MTLAAFNFAHWIDRHAHLLKPLAGNQQVCVDADDLNRCPLGGPERARGHLERVAAISANKKLGARVSWAEGVLVQRQDRAEFTRVLEEVVRADPGEVPRHRLANVLAQRRAKVLLAHADDLFL